MSIQSFLDKHRLPDSYRQTAVTFFEPLAKTLIQRQQQSPECTLYVGINGCQGSGKSTLADYLVVQFEQSGLSACAISIDDFYLTKSQRQVVSDRVHPLFITRGVPGTHDMELALTVLQSLRERGQVNIPRYNKAADDRQPESAWEHVTAPMNIVILEGWCVAVPPQAESDLWEPINRLESEKDPDGVWREFSNRCLIDDYSAVWDLLDYRIMLKAPSFDSVYRWRLEQEDKLRQSIANSGADDSGIMNAEQIRQFIAYYERLTRHALQTLPAKCQTVFSLDEQRQVVSTPQ